MPRHPSSRIFFGLLIGILAGLATLHAEAPTAPAGDPVLSVSRGERELAADDAIFFSGSSARGGEVTLIVENLGQRDLRIRSVAVLGDSFYQLERPVLPRRIAAGARSELGIAVAPTGPGLATGEVVLITNDPRRPRLRLEIFAEVAPAAAATAPGKAAADPEATKGAPDIVIFERFWQLEPQGAIVFPRREVGIPTTRTLRLHNRGSAPLSIEQTELRGSGFSFLGAPATTIAAGDFSEWVLRFTGAAAGPHSGELFVLTDDPDQPRWSLALAADVSAPGQLTLAPRRLPEKPAETRFREGFDHLDMVRIKLADDSRVTLVDGAFSDAGSGRLSAGFEAFVAQLTAAGHTLEAMFDLKTSRLREIRDTAEAFWDRSFSDLTSVFLLRLPSGADPAALCDALNAFAEVELASLVPVTRGSLRAGPPLVDPTMEQQAHLQWIPLEQMSFDGLHRRGRAMDVQIVWGGRGVIGTRPRAGTSEVLASVVVNGLWADHEAFNGARDLQIPDLNSGSVADRRHGTAVTSLLASPFPFSSSGISGVAHGLERVHVASAHGRPPEQAILEASEKLSGQRSANLLLIAISVAGPNAGVTQATGNPNFGWLPVEWHDPALEVIKAVIAAGRVVVVEAGDGAQDFDSANVGGPSFSGSTQYLQPDSPFHADNRSAAIYVAAADSDMERQPYSNHGTRVDFFTPDGLLAGGLPPALDNTGGIPEMQGYHSFEGTSASASLVGGLVALLGDALDRIGASHPDGAVPVSPLLTTEEARGTLGVSAHRPGPQASQSQGIGLLPNLTDAIRDLYLANIADEPLARVQEDGKDRGAEPIVDSDSDYVLMIGPVEPGEDALRTVRVFNDAAASELYIPREGVQVSLTEAPAGYLPAGSTDGFIAEKDSTPSAKGNS